TKNKEVVRASMDKGGLRRLLFLFRVRNLLLFNGPYLEQLERHFGYEPRRLLKYRMARVVGHHQRIGDAQLVPGASNRNVEQPPLLFFALGIAKAPRGWKL